MRGEEGTVQEKRGKDKKGKQKTVGTYRNTSGAGVKLGCPCTDCAVREKQLHVILTSALNGDER
jgi:hypothetical protein